MKSAGRKTPRERCPIVAIQSGRDSLDGPSELESRRVDLAALLRKVSLRRPGQQPRLREDRLREDVARGTEPFLVLPLRAPLIRNEPPEQTARRPFCTPQGNRIAVVCNHMPQPSRSEQQHRHQEIPRKGDRIELCLPRLGIRPRGTVFYVDDLQVLVKWDDGRSESLRPTAADRFRIIDSVQEQSPQKGST